MRILGALSMALPKHLGSSLAALVLVLESTGQAMAGPVLDFTGGIAIAEQTDAQTFGWEFVVAAPITITALGIWNEQAADGLINSHQLGLWNAIGSTLLTSTVITTANSTAVASSSSAGEWRFTPIVPVTLGPGDYFIGATYAAFDDDAIRLLTNAPSTIAGVTFFTSALAFGTALNVPGEAPGAAPGIFGPNLFVGPLAAAVPEPSTLAIVGFAVAGLAAFASRRLRSRRASQTLTSPTPRR